MLIRGEQCVYNFYYLYTPFVCGHRTAIVTRSYGICNCHATDDVQSYPVHVTCNYVPCRTDKTETRVYVDNPDIPTVVPRDRRHFRKIISTVVQGPLTTRHMASVIVGF